MDTEVTDTDASGSGTPPVKEGEKPRVYTQEEVEAKLRGQGKKLAEMEARLKAVDEDRAKRKEADTAAKRKAAEESGQYKELLTVAEQRAAELEAKLMAATEKETARLEAVDADNDKRRKTLPKALVDLIPDGLDPDAVARQIERLEKLKGEKVVAVHGGGGRSGEPVDHLASGLAAVNDKLFGKAVKK